MTGRPALFLDRDGVINIDHGHVGTIDRWEFMPGIFELGMAAGALGLALLVVTNQAGIGRGLYSEADFHRLTDWMKAEFQAAGIVIADVYFCPYHPTEGIGYYRRHSEDRKPGPGMLLRAALEHDIDLSQSIFFGDSETDMIAGRAAGVGRLILLSRNGAGTATVADVTVRDVAEAIQHLPQNPNGSEAVQVM
jgi:D-glycero-D-manno-heptose 1,7-bisphosphate phosphatase